VVGLCLVPASPGWAGNPASPNATLGASAIHSAASPLSFEENLGQVDGQVKYLARGEGYTLFLTPSAAVLGLRKGGAVQPTQWLRLELQGATAQPAIAGEDKLPGQSNYFRGRNQAQWRTNIPTYSRVRYQQVYPGVDLIYYGRQGRLENDFELNAGIDPHVISWQVTGAEGISVNSSGELVLLTGGSKVHLQPPRAYQGGGARQREVPIHYRVRGQKVGFELGTYDRGQKLTIDPVLTYSTYLGGTGGDVAYGVAINSAGNMFVTGITASLTFPTSSGTYQPAYVGDGDIFVTEFDPTGTRIVFSTYLGGTGVDTPAQILLNAAGNIFLVGSTTSSNFPTTSGVFQPNYGGIQDAFLTEMKGDGTGLVFSTYIGGSAADFGTAMTLDPAGDVYVVGSTQSTDFLTMNPLQLGNDGLYDAFVTEVSPTGALLYSTYLGGSQADYGTGIAVDTSGNVYVSGYTSSTDFPTQNALQSSLGGGTDIFVTKFRPGSTALLFSTYLGGSSQDQALSMIVDSSGNIYLTGDTLTGDTQSPNFPVTSTAYQSSLLGTQNTFLTKIAPGASELVFSTLFGGSGTDEATAMAIDSSGNIYLTGFTQSGNFPLLNAFQDILGTSGAGNCGSTSLINVPVNYVCADAFVAKFSPSGLPLYASFLGGSGTDSGQGIAVDSAGVVYVVGGTTSPNFPITSGSSPTAANNSTIYQPLQWLYQGSSTLNNAFVTRLSPQNFPSIGMTPQEINFGNQPIGSISTPVIVTVTNPSSTALSISSISATGDFQQTNTCGTSLAGGSALCQIQIAFAPTSLGLQTDEVTISDNASQSGSTVTQAITVTGDGVATGGSLLVSPSKLTFPTQAVGTTSPSQTALLINNGNQPITITNIVPSGNFTETNTCGTNFPTVSATLNVGQACTITVSFSPAATGNLTGSINIVSNAVNGAAVGLSGTGTAEFTLSANARSNVVLVGTSAANFTISAAAPSTFLTSINLSCSSGATCSFSPASIPAGQSSTLFISGLKATTANPLNVTVTGTSGGQTATLALSVFIADFSISAVPSGTTVTAGNNATYTITVSGTNGFNQGVLLSCPAAYPGIPVGTVCYWNPPAVLLTGTTTQQSSTLTITTEAQSKILRPPSSPTIPPGLTRWILLLAMMTFLSVILMGLGRSREWMRPRRRLAVLLVGLALVALAVGCENYVNPININPVVNGTPSGTSNIVLTGTLGNSSAVTRTTVVSLTVQP
jgi:hypothetical protein